MAQSCQLFFCFNQRLYEWVGLWEHHPDLFEQAHLIETEVGGSGFNWRQDGALSEIVKRTDSIKQKRAKQIVNFLYKKAQLPLLFLNDENEPDILQVVSCGLLCGK